MIRLKDILKESKLGMIREYTPSNPANIDKAIKEIEKLGVRNPINPKEIVIDNSVFVEVSNWDKRLWFSSLHSMDRGKGNASRVMQKIVDIADKYNVTIALDALPFGTGKNRMSRSQLVAFYKKFGFAFENGEEDFGDMERVPLSN
jgi:GNAT superfamily N-acetyltransferase